MAMNLYLVLRQHQPGRLYHDNHLARESAEAVLAELRQVVVGYHLHDFQVAQEYELGRLRWRPFSAPQMRGRFFIVPQGTAPRRRPRTQGQLSLFDFEEDV